VREEFSKLRPLIGILSISLRSTTAAVATLPDSTIRAAPSTTGGRIHRPTAPEGGRVPTRRQHVPDPPPGVNSNLPPVSASKPQTNRERLSMHLQSDMCASCHKLIDPIGFGFEKFDAIGARREKLVLTFRGGRKDRDKEPVKAELPLDTSGEIAGIPNSGFRSPKELAGYCRRVLSASSAW
jgi:hypothetical protein